VKFWKAVDGAQARLAADQAEDLRTAMKRSVDVDKVVDDWLRSHANTPSIRPSEARAWAKLNIRIDNTVTRAVWRRMLATGYVLGDDVAPVAIARSQLNKADAPDLSSIQTAINFDWSNWKAGNRAASALLQPPKGLSQLLTQTNASIAGMDATTLDRLGTVLADSLNTGASVTATAQDIVREGLASSLKVGLEAVLQDAQRAMTISRTEISRALNVSCRENYQELGVEKYEWLALEPCDDCEENDGVVIALGDEFPSGDTEPPVHPNCRCTILPVIDEGTPAIEDQSEGDVVDEELTGDVAPEMQDASDLISVDTHPDLTVETTQLEPTIADFKTIETQIVNAKDALMQQVKDIENQTGIKLGKRVDEVTKSYLEIVLKQKGATPEEIKNFIGGLNRGLETANKVETIENLKAIFPDQVNTINQQVVNASKFIENANVSINTNTDALEKILEDGRFKSQFETGTTGGEFNLDLRKQVEFGQTGTPVNAANEERPIYGALTNSYGVRDDLTENNYWMQIGNADNNRLMWYGNTTVVLDDAVRARTTFTIGDSLAVNAFGSPLSQATDITALENSGIKSLALGNNTQIPYFETQIHGGVSMQDVKEIWLPQINQNFSPMAKQQIEDLTNRIKTEYPNIIIKTKGVD